MLNWWRNGLHVRLGMRIYLDGLLIAVLYALAYWGARQISVDQFYLGAGVRVTALLLCPPRLWPYLFLGEYASLAHIRYPLIETYGLAWAIIGSAFVMPTVAIIVRLHRSMLTGTSSAWLLSLAAAAAIAAVLLSVAAAELLWPVSPSIPPSTRIVRQTLGDFLGILTIAPLALLWMRRSAHTEWSHRFPVPTIACLSLILVLGICSIQVSSKHLAATSTLHLLMVLPAIMLTHLHGWRGAAVSLPLLSASIGFSIASTGLPYSFDPVMYKTQQFFAVIAISLVALGSAISHYFERYKRRDYERRQAVAMARTSNLSGETHLRQRAMDINRIGDGIDIYLSETADWLKRQGHHDIANNLIRTASLYSRKFREQTSMVYPTALEHVGLYLALQAGGISEAWSNTGCVAQPRLIGDPCRLTVPL
nr:MASE1 domain-containing protein [Stenotrophomonas sp. ISL-67]